TTRTRSQPANSDSPPPSPPDAGKATAADAPQPPREPIHDSTKKIITISVVPSDAHIYRDGEDQGTQSAEIEVEQGASVEIEIRRRGYKTKKVSLDGSQETLSIRLDREAGIKRPTSPKDPKKEDSKPNHLPNNPPNQVTSPWK